MAIVRVTDLDFRYRDTWALRNVSFKAQRGEFLGVIGPNGSGKTTLMKVIDGILVPEKGGCHHKGACDQPHETERYRPACRGRAPGLSHDISLQIS